MTYPKSDTSLQDKIAHILREHVGRDNRISRDCLVHLATGEINDTNDRKVRDAIAGMPMVLSTLKEGGGYWWGKDITEANAYANEQWQRITGTIENVNSRIEYFKQYDDPEIVVQLELMEV